MVLSNSKSSRIPELEARLNQVSEPKTRIDLLNDLAWEARLLDYDKALAAAQEAYHLVTSGPFEQEPYPQGQVACLRALSVLGNDSGAFDQALTYALQALELLEKLPAESPITKALMVDIFSNLTWTYRSIGDYSIAMEYGLKGAKLAQELEDGGRECRVLNTLSVVYAENNDLKSALSIGQRVLARYREIDDSVGESISLNNQAMNYLDLGDAEMALETCQASLRLSREHGISSVLMTGLSTIGEIYLSLKDYAQAEDYLQQALVLARDFKSATDEYQCLINLGKIYLQQQKEAAALDAFQRALALTIASNDRSGIYRYHQMLSEVYERLRDTATALYHYKQFHEIKEAIFNETAATRLAGLNVMHQVETAKRDAEINYLKTIELKREIEERKKAQASLEKLAAIDPLTGLLNRREFFLLGETAFQYAIDSGHPLTAILLDLDYFKHINDSYGHAVGDQVLQQTARLVRENLRQEEIIGRYGGDEFLILLPGSTRAQGQQIAERLQESMAALRVETPLGELKMTLSLGIAELKETQSTTLEMLFDYADQALYAAKRAGRNRIATYPFRV